MPQYDVCKSGLKAQCLFIAQGNALGKRLPLADAL